MKKLLTDSVIKACVCQVLEIVVIALVSITGLDTKVASITGLNVDNPVVIAKENEIFVIRHVSRIKSFGFDPFRGSSDHVFELTAVFERATLLANLLETGANDSL